MNIEIRVITRARKREITREGASLKVKLVSLPRDGKANEELIESLAAYFGVRRSDVAILRGEKDKRKVVAIPLTEEEFTAKMGEMGVRK